MPPLSVLIKPASGNCDLRCRYCFYADETNRRTVKNYGMMSLDTLEQIVKKCLAYADISCSFGFQGGEPTLRGLDFYQRLMVLEKKHNQKKVKIDHMIQTNGMHLDQNWAAFFKKNHFLVGLSLDGEQALHDTNRIDAIGQGTFARAMATAALLEHYNVEFNILTVVTEQNAGKAGEIYRFFMEHGLTRQQYIACLDPLGSSRGSQPYSLCPESYGKFLIELFDLWYADRMRGRFVYNRYFENIAGLMLGQPPECCGMGRCSPQIVVEADGSVYPCDFYMLDEYRLGDLQSDFLPQIAERWRASQFVRESQQGLGKCTACQYAFLCRGGCRRDRQREELHSIGHNYFCSAYQRFFAHAIPKMKILLQRNLDCGGR